MRSSIFWLRSLDLAIAALLLYFVLLVLYIFLDCTNQLGNIPEEMLVDAHRAIFIKSFSPVTTATRRRANAVTFLRQAPVLLRVLLDSLLPPKKTNENSEDATKDSNNCAGRRKELERGWCFELSSAVLALLVEHVRSPHSAELWLELHYGLGTATARHRASLAAPFTIEGSKSTEKEESAECAAVRHTTDLLSQAVGHMGGILLREEAIGVKQAALLAEALAELTSPEIFWHSGTSPGCRRAVVELLSVALCGLHKQQRLVKTMPRVIRAAAAPSTDSADVTAAALQGAVDVHPALVLSRSLLGGVGAERTANKPPPMRVTRAVALRPLLEACAGPLSRQVDVALEVLIRVIHGTGLGLVFAGDRVDISGDEARGAAGTCDEDAELKEVEGDDLGGLVTVAGPSGTGGLPIGLAAGSKVCIFFRGEEHAQTTRFLFFGVPTCVVFLPGFCAIPGVIVEMMLLTFQGKTLNEIFSLCRVGVRVLFERADGCTI